MLFDKITPEQAGISSSAVARYIDFLERHGMNMHSLLLMKGDSLFAEYYWAPFTADRRHRLYSCTKSYVSLAIGLLLDEGKLSLDDTVASLLPEKVTRDLPPYLAEQTVRQNLMMTTCGDVPVWFDKSEPDLAKLYFDTNSADHPAGTYWKYDSAGSQLLCMLAEKLSGMHLLDYLKLKIFDKIGTFRDADVVRTKLDDSWGSSGMLCTSRDFISCARFVMNYGKWNGEQLLSESYLRDATAALSDNVQADTPLLWGNVVGHGYGYQFWRTENNGFMFTGMGDQLAVCLPDQDLIMVCTADNQGSPVFRQVLITAFMEMIVRPMGTASLPADPAAEAELAARTADLKLSTAQGEKTSPTADMIAGREYICPPNRTGITKFRFDFTENGGTMTYTNAQGEKVLPFGMCENVFAKFPQYGYSAMHGGVVTTDGFLYDGAFSGAWRSGNRLFLRVQIIDIYFGNATFQFSFKDNICAVHMVSAAQNFLTEYQGKFIARLAE